MNLGRLDFGVHGPNHCSVANPADHIEKTGIGVMGGRKGHLRLASVVGAGRGLSGSEWGVAEQA